MSCLHKVDILLYVMPINNCMDHYMGSMLMNHRVHRSKYLFSYMCVCIFKENTHNGIIYVFLTFLHICNHINMFKMSPSLPPRPC